MSEALSEDLPLGINERLNPFAEPWLLRTAAGVSPKEPMGWLQKLFGSEPEIMPVRLDDANFHAEVMQSELPVLIDFWSTTCAPCRQLEPVILNLTKEFNGQVKVCEANVEVTAKVCARLGIRSTPTVLYLHKGVEVERVTGFRGSAYHREIIQNELLTRASPPAIAKAAK